MTRILCFLFAFILLVPISSVCQSYQQPNAAEIKLKLRKLEFLGSVLYVAAHPDDENTRIITAMANGNLAATAYLSMTRGDGGQNLIGPEMRDLLGLIRTQELMTARAIDGGQQFFTRAVDFGFSKSADETFSIWGKDSILHDVIKVYRMFQPDVIVTRFPPDERAGHGHHTASAMLAIEAFDKAALTDVYPKQLSSLRPWQAKRLYTNTGRWWNNSINENTPGIVVVDVGGYSPLLGESFSEIAARSRSQHKSQGFGSSGTRGRQLEFLEYQKGERSEKNLFEGINTTWSRIKGGKAIQPILADIIQTFNEENPSASIPKLFRLRNAISQLEDNVWKQRKLQDVEDLIVDCSGMFLQVSASSYWVAPNENVQLNFELVNRSDADVKLERIQVQSLAMDSATSIVLKHETPLLFKTIKKISASSKYSTPYWLSEPHSTGLFDVKNYNDIAKPENDPAIKVSFLLNFKGENLTVNRPLIYKWNDPVKGELTRPFEIVPRVFVNLQQEVLVFKDQNSKNVEVLLKSASTRPFKGTLKFELPEGWRTEPDQIDFSFMQTGEEQYYSFAVFPSANEMTGTLKAVAMVDGKKYDHAVRLISYDHIPTQTLLPPAAAKIVRVDLQNSNGIIGYVKGAGDDVPAALRNIGYEVRELKNEDVTLNNLKNMDAVVLGIRALNTNDRMRFIMPALLSYVKEGGVLVVQYNTSFDLDTEAFSPYPLKIARDRVTDENSEVRILKPEHQVFNYPNKITAQDFDHWIQERGLYFPGEWDDRFEALLSMNDKNESPKNGSLLVAKYGEGYYVYTGLSFFRELPEGVAGAYKLFANLVSLNKKEPLSAVPVPPKQTKKKNR